MRENEYVPTDLIDEPMLLVRAESTDSGISVAWTHHADGERRALAIRRLKDFLARITDVPVVLSRRRTDSVVGVPDPVGSLHIEVDDVRFEKGFIEPSAAQREQGSSIGFDGTDWRLPTVMRCEYGPKSPSGPATTWAHLVDAVRRDIQRQG